MDIKVITHSGNEYVVTVELFDPVRINDDLNNPDINTVVFGNVIVSRIDVKTIVPIIKTDESLTEPLA
jgi:hypothetical protein